MPVARAGFTLIELLLVMSMLATLASLAIPQVDKMRDRGRVTEALSDLKNLESQILAHYAVNGSLLPVDLAEIGEGGKLDPWGNAYVYTPFGLSITYGCQSNTGGGNGGGGNGGGNGGGGNGGGGNGNGGGGNGGGGSGQCNGPPPSGARKDKFLVPVNSDFDLFSAGPDGQWVAPFTAEVSRDDIVRAGNGGFFGVAEQF